MLEVNLFVLLGLILPYSGNMRIQVFPLCELLPTVAASIALSMLLCHVLPKLGLFLKRHLFLAQIACKPPLMGPLHMLSLLVTIREGLQAPATFLIRTL